MPVQRPSLALASVRWSTGCGASVRPAALRRQDGRTQAEGDCGHLGVFDSSLPAITRCLRPPSL